MQEKWLLSAEEYMQMGGALNNTGFQRSYHKTDKVSSNYFETETPRHWKDKTLLSVGGRVPQGVENVEEWLFEIVKELGYDSWEKILPHLNLPVEEAIVVDCPDPDGVVFQDGLFGFIKHAVILSKCNLARYDPQSPVIFTHKRIHRSITLVTIDLKTFYELD